MWQVMKNLLEHYPMWNFESMAIALYLTASAIPELWDYHLVSPSALAFVGSKLIMSYIFIFSCFIQDRYVYSIFMPFFSFSSMRSSPFLCSNVFLLKLVSCIWKEPQSPSWTYMSIMDVFSQLSFFCSLCPYNDFKSTISNYYIYILLTTASLPIIGII